MYIYTHTQYETLHIQMCTLHTHTHMPPTHTITLLIIRIVSRVEKEKNIDSNQ